MAKRREPQAVRPPSQRTSDVRLARDRATQDVPQAWMEKLLAASVDLPIASDERAVVQAMLGALAAILPAYALGICFVPEGSSAREERVVVKRVPGEAPRSEGGIDPTRIFPGFAREHVAPIAGSTGCTLHVASDDDSLDADRSIAARLADIAASALGASLARAREIASLIGPQTAVRSSEERMVQAEKLATFGQLAAGLVHELNNPLTSIVAYSDFLIRKALSDGGGKDPEDLERLKRIGESANRMLRLTRDLVGYARPSGGIVGPVVLHAVVDQAVAFCEHVLSASKMRIVRRYGEDVRTVRGANEQLVQVFVNLLTNACQAARPDGGSIVVATSIEGGARAIVVVEDDGAGIAREHLPKVFTPFFTTKSRGQGTGLGLSIVKSIIDNHDGDIRVDSTPGRGARFVIELPVDPSLRSG